MSHYEDLEPCDYIRFNPARRHLALAVGWLEPGFEYNRGAVDTSFLDRLHSISLTPSSLAGTFYGWHSCALVDCCVHADDAPSDSRFSPHCTRELYVPFEGCLLVSPQNVGHYVSSHGYLPPKPFIDAVERCPPIDSDEYHELTWRFFKLTGRDLGPVLQKQPWSQ